MRDPEFAAEYQIARFELFTTMVGQPLMLNIGAHQAVLHICSVTPTRVFFAAGNAIFQATSGWTPERLLA